MSEIYEKWQGESRKRPEGSYKVACGPCGCDTSESVGIAAEEKGFE